MRLPAAQWRTRSGLNRVMAALSVDGGAVRAVGGAVRDTLLGLTVTDVDLATPLHPDNVIQRLEADGIKAVPTGISHGTITAVADGDSHEITTLRRDVATDGRRATVDFANDWQEDAARRDFTINALYADLVTGEIFDWFGGIDDLKAQRVVFIGDAATRIGEDVLRILRYYRFAARFGGGKFDAPSHAAVVAHRALLKSLSRERVADELFKLLNLPDPRSIVRQMANDGIWGEILPEFHAESLARLDRLWGNEVASGVGASALRRLAALIPSKADAADNVASRLRLSTRQKKHLTALASFDGMPMPLPVGQMAYQWGPDIARDACLLRCDAAGAVAAVQGLADWERPVLGIKGGDIVARGIAAGPDVARLLKAVEADWIAEDFPGGDRALQLLDQKIGSISDLRQ